MLTFNVLSGQTEKSWEDILDRIGQTEDVDNGNLELLYDELSELSNNKFDINTCTRSELEELPFLDHQQVMDIMEYRDRVGRFETPMELYLIRSLDRQTIAFLRQFVVFSPALSADTIPSLKNIFKYGKNVLIADVHVPFYERKGDKNGYLGYKYRHWLRYSFNYGQHVKFGLTASQDAGEPFFAGKNKAGYDFYSPYLLLRDMKRLKALALGHYRLTFGMGLILNTGYGFGKLSTLSSLTSSSNHIYAHSSRTESNYLQGGAATFSIIDGLDITAFASYRKIDATLNKDSSTVRTILTTGYHRTQSEMERRRNTSETLVGGNINYLKNGFHVGVTGYYTSFNRELKMNTGQKYRRWYPEGSSFWNMSIDYGYLSNKLTIAGETAIDKNSEVATINTLSYQIAPFLTLSALQRYFPYRYQAIYAKTFAEGGTANDESGVFLGGKIKTAQNAIITFYSDISYFAWPKYRASQSSYRWDNFLQIDAMVGRWSFLARYRVKMKEMDNSAKTDLIRRYEHRGRVAVTYGDEHLSLRSQADVSFMDKEVWSRGYMLSESGLWQIRRLRVRGSVGYFHTDDYDSRVYGHEPGLLYYFYFPSFSGHGMRYSLSLRTDISTNLLFIVKGGMTHYFDRSIISSGLQQIEGSSQTDMEVQVRLKF